MRLEIEPTMDVVPMTGNPTGQKDLDLAEAKSALSQGIKAAQAGNRVQARISLLRATALDPGNENAWLWLASISEYPEELLGFLNNVLEINPNNERACEWRAATHSLLAKTFVQRGVDAVQDNQKDFAAECFQKALEYDEKNSTAWVWMASLSDSSTVKVSMLEKAVALDPTNESAVSALQAAKDGILKERLNEAKSAAVTGNNGEAIKILESLLLVNPNSIEAWTMLSHLVDGFDEKIRCFESILAIDPNNIAAKAGRDSLLAIFGTADVAISNEAPEPESMESSAPADEAPLVDLEAPAETESHELEPPVVLSEETYIGAEVRAEETKYGEQDIAEPFASYAEEAPSPFTAVGSAGELESAITDELSSDDLEHEHEDLAYADPQAQTVTFSYGDVEPEPHEEEETGEPDVPMNSDPNIPMPQDDLPAAQQAVTGYETVVEPRIETPFVEEPVIEAAEVLEVEAHTASCPFCNRENDGQAVTCSGCRAVLTLSDLELLLANQNAQKMVLRQAVDAMERQRLSRSFDIDELVTLGLGHLNLRNLQLGYACLAEASRMNPNNVVLSGQVNSLLIRLEEIKLQEEAHLRMPKGKSILVVDDSPTVRKLIAGKLEKCGHEVVCASDGVEAMERLEGFVPDLVLLDITMPRMDGYQVCKLIRSNPATKDVTVVMISGKDGFFDKVRGRMAGTTGYITKPFGPETLMKAVEMYLSGEAPELEEV